jgi:PII-like signaling protein
MKTESEAVRLRVYVNESDRIDGRPVYEVIIRAAKQRGLQGATALRGIEGYGVSRRVHSVKVLHLSDDVPIVVEIVDSEERIAMLVPVLDKIVAEGAMTLERVRLAVYRRDNESMAEILAENEIQLDSDSSPQVAPSPDAGVEFTEQAHKVIVAAGESAAESRRVYVDSVDVLLAMLCEAKGVATKALKKLGVDCKSVERALRETVDRDENAAKFLRTLEAKAMNAARWLEDDYTGSEHLLLALCQIRPTAATDILTRLGAQPRDICAEVLNIIGHEGDWQRWLADHPEL